MCSPFFFPRAFSSVKSYVNLIWVRCAGKIYQNSDNIHAAVNSTNLRKISVIF